MIRCISFHIGKLVRIPHKCGRQCSSRYNNINISNRTLTVHFTSIEPRHAINIISNWDPLNCPQPHLPISTHQIVKINNSKFPVCFSGKFYSSNSNLSLCLVQLFLVFSVTYTIFFNFLLELYILFSAIRLQEKVIFFFLSKIRKIQLEMFSYLQPSYSSVSINRNGNGKQKTKN